MVVDWIVTTSVGCWVFFVCACVFSIFYGSCCWTINELDWDEMTRTKDTFRWDNGTLHWKWHQIWLNFLGSAVGWWAFWCFLVDYREHRNWHTSLTYIDFFLGLVAFLGVTGRLPHISRYGSKLFPLKKDE